MSEDFQTAMMLMSVGMLTVFIILLLVVYVGKSIILITNRLEVKQSVISSKSSSSSISANKIAAITAAVNVVTQGKGRIENIEKI
mgnify:CR=1 FL=1